MIGKMHFYTGNIRKAHYYHDRSIRGKEEVHNSKVRQLSEIVYVKKMRDRDYKFLTGKEIRKKEENHFGKVKLTDGFNSTYRIVSDQVGKLAKKVMEIAVKSRAGYYKLIDKQKLEQLVLPSQKQFKEEKRLRKLSGDEEKINPQTKYYLRQHKIQTIMDMSDQTTDGKSLIQRCGTPIYEMEVNELPSPVIKSNASNVKLLPFAFPLYERKGDDDDEMEPDNGKVGPKEKKTINRSMMSKAGHANYLKEFQDQLEDSNNMTIKLWKEISNGTELVIDTREIFQRQKIKLNQKAATSIFMGHLSPNRVNKDAQETNKLEILLSFAKLREVIENELDLVIYKRDDNPQNVTYISIAETTKSDAD